MSTAKIFMNGRSQAVRLPKEYRLRGKEVFIRRDEATGDVILSETKAGDPNGWGDFFERMREGPFDPDFLKDRKNMPQQKRDWMYDDRWGED